MTENAKLRFEPAPNQPQQGAAGGIQSNEESSPNGSADASQSDVGQVDDAESQMRKALGLLGEPPRHRPDAERNDPPHHRSPDRFSGGGGGGFNGGGLHRRRFVQDGDVPVTVLRREPGHEVPANRSTAAAPAPSASRLQRTEAALAAETAGREKAERQLAEAQAMVRDLQTKIGHADLAKTEALEALKRERDHLAELRAELETLGLRSEEAEQRADTAEKAAAAHQDALADERQARKLLEKSLTAAEAARDAAQELVQELSVETPVVARLERPARRRPAADPDGVTVSARQRRPTPAPVVATDQEPEPVKWWLTPPKPAARRR